VKRILAASVVSCLAVVAPAVAGSRCDLDRLPGPEVLVRYPLPDGQPQTGRHRNDHIPFGFAAGPVAFPGAGIGSDDPRVIGVGDFIPGGPCDLLWEEADPDLNGESDQPELPIRMAVTAGPTQALPPDFLGGVIRPSREWQVAGTYDLTGDGRADVLWVKPDTGNLMLWVRTATGWTVAPVSGGLPPQSIESVRPVSAIVHIEVDAPPGIVAQASPDGSLFRYFRAWWNGGSLRLESAGLVKGLPYGSLAAVGDFDEDGIDDLLLQRYSTSTLDVCYMQGTTASYCAPLTPPTFELPGYSLGWFVAGPR
jgi:hypothetical protein